MLFVCCYVSYYEITSILYFQLVTCTPDYSRIVFYSSWLRISIWHTVYDSSVQRFFYHRHIVEGPLTPFCATLWCCFRSALTGSHRNIYLYFFGGSVILKQASTRQHTPARTFALFSGFFNIRLLITGRQQLCSYHFSWFFDIF